MDSVAPQTFPRFSELPLDIRRIVWQFALAIPRIVEYEPKPDDLFISLNLFRFGIHYRPIPHALSITCRESRKETLRTYELDKPRNEANGVVSNFWTRFDYDIVHFRDLYFAADCSGYAPRADWAFSPWRIYYKGKPAEFENIETVAMPWEFWRTERFDALISNFFPKLKVLIFLIDDSKPNSPRHEAISLTEITTLYKEPSERKLLPAFVREATGPFAEVVLNKDFESEVLDLAERFQKFEGWKSWSEVVFCLPLRFERQKILKRGLRT